MSGKTMTGRGARTATRTATFPARRSLVAAARRVLWDLVRGRARTLPGARSVLRRRLGDFLRGSAAGRLHAILRSAALAGAVAAALLAPSSARAQAIGLPPIELAAIARGEGGFVARGEGEPASGAGQSVSGAGDVNGDGIPDLIVGGRFDFYSVSTSTPAYVVFGRPGGAAVELAEVLAGRGGFAIRGGAEFDQSGWSVSGAGDVNGDGLADLLIGAPHAGPGGRDQAGESYVVFGKKDGATVELSDVQAGRGGFAIRGIAAGDRSGWSVSGPGDVNGDGLADLLIGAPHAEPMGRYDAGESYVVFGKIDGAAVELSDVQTGRGGFAIRGTAEYGASGTSVSGPGDVNGDGLADLLIGAPFTDSVRLYGIGESYVVFGKKDGAVVDLAHVLAGRGGFAIRGVAAYDYSGWSVSGAGDVNGDGLADLLVGSYYISPAGGPYSAGGPYTVQSYVVFGKKDGAAVELADVLAGRSGFAIRGATADEPSGLSVSGAGDVNGDGLADLLIGTPLAGQYAYGRLNAGESYVVFGKKDGATVELADVLAGRGGFAIRGAEKYDSSGWSVSGAGDVNGDGLADIVIGAPFAKPEGRGQAGESYVVFGKPDGATVELSDVHAGLGGFAILGSAEGDASALSVSDAGDVNGDGLADFIIGARQADPQGRDQAGESYVVFGKLDGPAVDLADIREGRGGFAIRGIAVGGLSGWSVSGAGDVNGDGLADLLIGAPEADVDVRFKAGESYVVFGKPDGAAVELSDVQAGRGGFAIRGGSAGNDHSGRSVSGAGDVNGDGLADLIIGAPDAHNIGGVALAGESYVVFGKPDGAAVELDEVQAGQGGFAIRGITGGDRSGTSVSGAGDVNGDGLADLLIGAPNANTDGRLLAGESYVVFGKKDGAVVDLADVLAGRGGFAMRGIAEGDHSGRNISGAGDVNGDGLADVLIGADYASPRGRSNSGESYVVFGKPGGAVVELAEVLAGRGGFAIRGIAGNDHSGRSVSRAGDVNGDGLSDLLIGAYNVSLEGRDRAGESYVVFGKKDGTAVDLAKVQEGRGGFAIRGSAAYDESGSSVSGAGDVNGDGLADLLIGARLADARYPSISLRLSGAAYVIFGRRDAGSSPRFRRGDSNADGATDISDAVATLSYMFLGDKNVPCEQAGDVDDDGALDISDAIYVVSYLFLGGEAIKPPVGTCGIDPTGHSLSCGSFPGCP